MYWEETRLGTHEVVLVRDLLWKFMFEIFDFLYFQSTLFSLRHTTEFDRKRNLVHQYKVVLFHFTFSKTHKIYKTYQMRQSLSIRILSSCPNS